MSNYNWLWLIPLLFLVVVLLYPIRIRVEAKLEKTLHVAIFWQPLGFLQRLVRVKTLENQDVFHFFHKEDGQAKNEIILKEQHAQQETQEQQQQANKPVKPKHKSKKEAPKETPTEKKWRITKADIKPLVHKSLKKLSLEDLKIKANINGDPAISAIGGGFLWTILGHGLGVLSTKLKKYPKAPELNIGLNLTLPWLAQGEVQLMVRLWDALTLGCYVLALFWKNRREEKAKTKKIAKAV